MTAVRCGNAAGVSGPTFVLLKGKEIKSGFTPAFMEQHGAAPGSRCIMAPSAFMTNEAWDDLAGDLADGIRAMPVVRYVPHHPHSTYCHSSAATYY